MPAWDYSKDLCNYSLDADQGIQMSGYGNCNDIDDLLEAERRSPGSQVIRWAMKFKVRIGKGLFRHQFLVFAVENLCPERAPDISDRYYVRFERLENDVSRVFAYGKLHHAKNALKSGCQVVHLGTWWVRQNLNCALIAAYVLGNTPFTKYYYNCIWYNDEVLKVVGTNLKMCVEGEMTWQ